MADIAALYARWAEFEARGSSAQYESWARAIAADGEACHMIDELPIGKRQPNLVFAAARHHSAPDEAVELLPWLRDNWPAVRTTVLERATQTNEPARCATLLMALDRISGPIALLEVGASAGLCLIPDFYRYRFHTSDGVHTLEPLDSLDSPTIECALSSAAPPTSLPDIVWRRGLDLNPISLDDEEQRAWLETLIWPEHLGRRERLRAAMDVALRARPRVDEGDLLTRLADTAHEAPSDATLVITHSAVLAYLNDQQRAEAQRVMRATGARIVSLEGVDVVPDITAALPPGFRTERRFVLALDGEPLGLAAPHGVTFEGLPLLSARPSAQLVCRHDRRLEPRPPTVRHSV